MAVKSNFRAGRDNGALTENVELLTGQRGDGLDRAITLRELNNLGLASLSRINGVYTSKNGTVPGSSTPGVVDFPGKPLNVTVNGAFNTILIAWDEPNYRSHAYAEVWRAETDNLSVAVMIGTSAARMYSDPIGGDAHVYYWVRFVNKNDVPGPYNSTAGTYGETAVDIGQLLDSLTGQIADSQLTTALSSKIDGAAAGVTTLNSTVSYMDTNGSAAYRAMWAVKANVGDITAGIGLMVSGSTSQVMISASQVFVFDPNAVAPTQALFAISDGAVVMRKAIIEAATIETVQAMTITADYVVSGISVTSPVIVGGSLSLGSGDNSLYCSGGSLGIGKGGSYGGWGYGWHTIIYSDGSLYTDRLYASAGSFTGTVNANAGTFNNVTINENCDVKGTIYANKIVGDVVAIKDYSIAYAAAARLMTTIIGGTFASSTKTRLLLVSPITLTRYGTVTEDLHVYIYINGAEALHIQQTYTNTFFYPWPVTIPANANISFSVQVYCSNSSYFVIPAQHVHLTVTPTSSGTFI